jgi:hypothetical protein
MNVQGGDREYVGKRLAHSTASDSFKQANLIVLCKQRLKGYSTRNYLNYDDGAAFRLVFEPRDVCRLAAEVPTHLERVYTKCPYYSDKIATQMIFSMFNRQ